MTERKAHANRDEFIQKKKMKIFAAVDYSLKLRQSITEIKYEENRQTETGY